MKQGLTLDMIAPDRADLVERIESRNGILTMRYAIDLDSVQYALVEVQ
jgi:hypothetical protein